MLTSLIQKLTPKYIENTKGRLLYVSDHAIVRYLERVKGLELTGDTDEEKLKGFYTKPIMEEILTPEDEVRILNGIKGFYHKTDYTLVIKELSVVTILI